MTKELKAQQQIAHSYQALEGLYRIAAALNPALTEAAVAQTALDRLLDFPGITGGRIALFDLEGRLRPVGQRDFGPGPDPVLPCANCGCERRLLAGELHAPVLSAAGEPALQAHACIPLVTSGRTLGLMSLLTGPASLSDDDWQLLETVGNQVAIAVERAHLYADMEALVEERTLARQSERKLLAAVVNTSAALVFTSDAAGGIMLFNPACEQSMGWSSAEVLGRPAWEVFRKVDGDQEVRRFFEHPPGGAAPVPMRGDWLARDGSTRSIIWSASCVLRPDQSIEHIVATGLDVTALRGAEERLDYLSHFDVLTGLPNRMLLRDRVRQLQEKTVAGKSVMGFLLVRFDRLRPIRDSLGADAEQAALVQIAGRLGEWSHGDDSVARCGDVSFAIVAARSDTRELSLIARQVLSVMARPFQFETQELHLDPCIGIAVFPSDGDDYDTIAQGAEAAMRRAHDSKGERYEFYRPELNQGAQERFKLECAMRRALERNEFLLHYQPQVDLAGGAIIGFEALIRWQHPELGLIAPGRFIGLAEETGLILPIGEWVLRQACEQSCAWQRAGLRPVPVSVNLSARQFSENIAATVQRILHDTGLDPKLLELELTESASMEDPEKSFEILCQLKAMGIKLAIDDFGTGYSNLNYLKRFPVDKIKLDQSFVRDIISDPDDLAISRAVIAMAHSLRLTVIAEGVETAGQLALLAANGCDEMQGYYFSRPVEAAACERLLRENAALPMDTLLRQPYRRTLLYVDDEVNLQGAIRRAMRHKGYRVLTATNAAEAFEILATAEVGVILCDQRMPGMSGTAFLSRVKHMYPAVARMVLSGYTDLQSVTDAVNHGAIFKFLTKPWVDDELSEAVREAFAEFESKRAPPRHVGHA